MIKMKQVLLVREYYKSIIKKYSKLPEVVDNLIFDYIMDLYYAKFKKNMIKQYHSSTLMYVNYLDGDQGLWINMGLGHCMAKKCVFVNVAKFLRLFLYEVHGLGNFRFYKKDLEIIKEAIDRIKFIVFDCDRIKFYCDGPDLTMSYNIFASFITPNKSPYLEFRIIPNYDPLNLFSNLL